MPRLSLNHNEPSITYHDEEWGVPVDHDSEKTGEFRKAVALHWTEKKR